MSEWINVPENLDEWLGFVYIIERINALPGERRYYIGKKMLWSNVKMKPLKGMKKNRRVLKSSDWKKYYGSSNELKDLLKLHGPDNFKRTILHLCESKWIMSFMEALEQLRHGVLFDEESFNGIFHLRINKCPVIYREKYRKISEEFFKKAP